MDLRFRNSTYIQTIINICLQKNKSKQSYIWIDSIFEAKIIYFGTEKDGVLDFSYNKCALSSVHGLKGFRDNSVEIKYDATLCFNSLMFYLLSRTTCSHQLLPITLK